MSETNDERSRDDQREESEVGLVPDEDLPEDLRPSDDNPLAKDPDDAEESEEEPGEKKVEGMPDIGQPGPG